MFWKENENPWPVQKDLAVFLHLNMREYRKDIEAFGLKQINICWNSFECLHFWIFIVYWSIHSAYRKCLWEGASFWHLVEGNLCIPGCPFRKSWTSSNDSRIIMCWFTSTFISVLIKCKPMEGWSSLNIPERLWLWRKGDSSFRHHS